MVCVLPVRANWLVVDLTRNDRDQANAQNFIVIASSHDRVWSDYFTKILPLMTNYSGPSGGDRGWGGPWEDSWCCQCILKGISCKNQIVSCKLMIIQQIYQFNWCSCFTCWLRLPEIVPCDIEFQLDELKNNFCQRLFLADHQWVSTSHTTQCFTTIWMQTNMWTIKTSAPSHFPPHQHDIDIQSLPVP